jgi:hypothetical protein
LMPERLQIGLALGFVVVLCSTFLLDKAGDYFYRKGIAKPFYLFGHRLHHRHVLASIVPASYVVVAGLLYVHYARVLWASFWPSLEITLFLAGACLTIDMTLDALSAVEKKRALLHHEWVYVLVPAYAFTHLVALV